MVSGRRGQTAHRGQHAQRTALASVWQPTGSAARRIHQGFQRPHADRQRTTVIQAGNGRIVSFKLRLHLGMASQTRLDLLAALAPGA